MSDDAAKIKRLRADMTEVDKHVHFNNAGDSPMSLPVLNKVKEVLDLEHVIGGYAAADQYKDELAAVYVSIGRLINAESPQEEIALVDSATTAWVKAFYSIPLQPGDVILLSHVEYAANFVAALQRARRDGAVIEVVDSDSAGLLCTQDLRQRLTHHGERVKIVCVTWIPTNGGVISDAAAVGALCRELAPDCVYLLDACQAAGQLSIDVKKLQCDALSATGRKYLRGPRGTGFLYVRRSRLRDGDVFSEPATLDHYAAPWTGLSSYAVHKGAKRFEQWERSVANLLGLGAAVDYALDADVLWAEARARANGLLLRCKLRKMPTVTLHDLGDQESQCGIVTFSVEGVDAATIKARLHEVNTYVAVAPENSTLVDSRARNLPPLVRASLHYFNTAEEIGKFCDHLRTILPTC
ncbi:aminotransferase class V [Ochromonadaceae sp. CCMP2298]|nr:aminotransferase class V [Ochromonadaceae sp. CCMP2298]